MAKTTALQKPTFTREAVTAFAEAATGATSAPTKGKVLGTAQSAPTGYKSGLVPEGDVRLTANIRGDLHLKLKIKAAEQRTTVGELIERWVESW